MRTDVGNRSERLTVVCPFWREKSATWRDGPDVGLGVNEKSKMMAMVLPPMVAAILPDPAVVAVIGWLPKEKGFLWRVGDLNALTERWCRRNGFGD